MSPSSPDEVGRLERLPSRLLSRAALLASRLVTEALDEVNGHRYEFAVLVVLEEGGPATQAQLCRRTGIDASDMTAVVSTLVDAGYVSRSPDPEDGRRNVVRLEPTGRGRLQELDTAVTRAQDELLEGWSAAERDRLVSLLAPLAARAGH